MQSGSPVSGVGNSLDYTELACRHSRAVHCSVTFSGDTSERNLLESREDNRIPGRAVAKRLEGRWPGLTAWHRYLFLALAVLAIAQFTPAIAQFTPAATASDAADPLTTLLEQARADGLRVIILEPGDKSPEAGDAAAAGPGFGQRVTHLTGRLVQRFGEVIDASPGQLSDFVAKVAALSPLLTVFMWPST